MDRKLRASWERYWRWYERHYTINVTVATALFLLQLIHLYWLTTDVVVARLFGVNYWPEGDLVRTAVVLVDYTEIPAIASVSMVYVNELRKRFNAKDLAYLVAVDIQIVHLFWITDEFVVQSFGGEGGYLPLWLAWVAIFIDYLELPVIFETLQKAVHALRTGDVERHLEEDPGD